MSKGKFRIIPLGGCGEIGKNMTVFEQGNDAVIVDTGIMFPANDMFGVDYIIPDFGYLKTRKDLTIHGILITHGHEDHIGAIEHVAQAFPDVPIYATRLTAGLIEVKLREARIRDYTMNVFNAGDTVKVGPFKVEAFHMCHSIPDCVGFAFETPYGYIIHSGDYKFDNTPVDGRKPDYARLAGYGQKGVKLLMADSTNADRAGWTPSEATIEPAFEKVFRRAKGRIIVATFASLISRIQLTVKIAQQIGRKVAILGTTMREYVKLAREINYLDIPENILIDPNKLSSYEPHKVIIMVTGAQGEPSAVLSKMATGSHKVINVMPDDTIVLSSHPIPGNEESVYRTINKLIERGADVVYDPLERVHVSGHACQEEMRLLINLTQPEFLMPVHGERRHLVQHGKIGETCGVAPQNVILAENGMVMELDKYGVRKTNERVPGGWVFVDGSSVGEIGPAVIRDREILARDGFLVVSVSVDRRSGNMIGEPEIISRGFIYIRDADEIMSSVRATTQEVLRAYRSQNGKRREAMEESISKLLYNETGRRPMVFGIINEV